MCFPFSNPFKSPILESLFVFTLSTLLRPSIISQTCPGQLLVSTLSTLWTLSFKTSYHLRNWSGNTFRFDLLNPLNHPLFNNHLSLGNQALRRGLSLSVDCACFLLYRNMTEGSLSVAYDIAYGSLISSYLCRPPVRRKQELVWCEWSVWLANIVRSALTHFCKSFLTLMQGLQVILVSVAGAPVSVMKVRHKCTGECDASAT